MRAIAIEQFGETPRLRELPVPEPGRGEVQVTIEAAATNPLDSSIAAGHLATLGEYRFPLTLGMDGVGTVTAVGDEVDRFAVGDRVYGQFWSQPYRTGTFADVTVVQARPAFGALTTVPAGLSGQVAAAIPTSGMTALGAIDHARVPEGGTVLIIGATGGVGTYAVQIAAANGVRVIATSSSAVSEEVRKLGADEVVVRGAESLDSALRRHAPGGVDAIIDAVGDRTLVARLANEVRTGGVVISTAFGVGERLLADERIDSLNYRIDRKPDRLAAIGELVARGVVRPVIGAELPLEEAPRALAGDTGARGLRGKTVVRVL